MKELTNSEIQALEDKAYELREESSKLFDLAKDMKKKLINLDFKGKYIRYGDEFDSNPIYMKVDWITEDKIRYARFDYSYMFRGLGFFGEFTGYGDATEFDWSYWFEFYIYGDGKNFFKKVDKIEEITKEEFDEAFEEMLKSVREYHYKHIGEKDE